MNKHKSADFKTFEAASLGGNPPSSVYIYEPQGILRKSTSIKSWNKIGIGKSKISGMGVYAVDYIEEGEVFEVAPMLFIPAAVAKDKSLIDYVFKINDETYAIGLGNSSLYNHRNQPMAEWQIDENAQTITYTANRNISAGEEIYVTYGKKYWSSRGVNPDGSSISKYLKNIG
jgi:SET domain-containing protein